MSREILFNLMNVKKELEKMIEDQGCILEANRTDMKEPLVDKDGFPRNDIDVMAVRKARNAIICFQNERRTLMEQIEKGLHELHQEERDNLVVSGNVRHQNHQEPMDTADDGTAASTLQPFAAVELLQPGLLAERAGLQVGDQILQLGTLSARNFKSLQQIQTVVSHSVGRSITFKVHRPDGDTTVDIEIKLNHASDCRMGIKFKLL